MARRVGAAFVIGVLLISGAASASLVYRCPMMRVAQKRCCCPPAPHDVTTTPSLSRGCCRAVELEAPGTPPWESSRASAPSLAPASVPFDPPAALPTPRLEGRHAARPRAIGPPLLLAKQSFLI